MFLNAKTTGTDVFNSYIEMANKQIAKFGKQVLNPDTFYTKQLLDTIRVEASEYVYFRYADTQPMGEKANKLLLRRWAPLQAHTVPLTEGIPPISDKGSVEIYEIDTNQYGRYMEFSDKVNFKVVDPIIAHYASEYSIVAVETLDLLAREALFSIANKVYAGYAAGVEALTETSKPTITDLRKTVLGLKKQLVKPRSNGRYHVIAGPDFFYDMVSDPTVEQYMRINNTTKTMYDDSMLVPMFNMEFYETLTAPTHGEFTKIVDGAAKKALRIYEVTEGKYTFRTLTEDDVLTAGGKVLKEVSGYVTFQIKRSGILMHITLMLKLVARLGMNSKCNTFLYLVKMHCSEQASQVKTVLRCILKLLVQLVYSTQSIKDNLSVSRSTT